jgi:hypothetical protein
MEAQLKERAAMIHDLKTKVEKGREQMSKDDYALIEDLEAKQDAAWDQLLQLKEAANQHWKDLKADMEHHWEDLYKAVARAISKFEETV